MRDVLILFVHLIVTVVRLAGPGGLRSVVAESALVRHQLLILNRGRKRGESVPPEAAGSVSGAKGVKPRRPGDATRWIMATLSQMFAWLSVVLALEIHTNGSTALARGDGDASAT